MAVAAAARCVALGTVAAARAATVRPMRVTVARIRPTVPAMPVRCARACRPVRIWAAVPAAAAVAMAVAVPAFVAVSVPAAAGEPHVLTVCGAVSGVFPAGGGEGAGPAGFSSCYC